MASAIPPAFVLRGHAASITALTFTLKSDPDQSKYVMLVSGDGQGLVKFWSLQDRRCALTLDPEHQIVNQSEQQSFQNDPAYSILALICRDDTLIVQRKDGRISFMSICWQSMRSKDQNVHQKSIQHLWCIETGAFSFFRMSLCSTQLNTESSHLASNLLVVSTNPGSNLHIIDIEQRKSCCLIECEQRTSDEPKQVPDVSIDQSNVLDLSRLTALFPYGRKHGMCMAGMMYSVKKITDNVIENDLHLVIAAESGSVLLMSVDVTHRRSNILRELRLTSGDPLVALTLCFEKPDTDNTDSRDIEISGVTAGTDLAVRPFIIREPVSSSTLPDLIALPEVPLAATSAHSGVNALLFASKCSRLAVAGWDHRTRLFQSSNFVIRSGVDGGPPCTRELVPESLLKCHTKSVQSLAYYEDATPNSSRALIAPPSSSALARYAVSSRQSAASTPSSWLVSGGEDAHIAVYTLK